VRADEKDEEYSGMSQRTAIVTGKIHDKETSEEGAKCEDVKV